MTNPFFPRAVIASLGVVAAMSLACSKSSPAPTAPGPTPLTVTAISPATGLTGDKVTISGVGFLSGATVLFDGVRASVTSVVNTTIVAAIPVHAAGTVDVVVANRDGQSGTLTGGFTHQEVALTVSSSVVTAGGQLSVSWVAPSGRSSGDWVSLFKVADTDANHGWFEHTGGATSGTVTLNAPEQPGQYEFRYLVGDHAVTRSSPVTVTAPGN